MGFFNECSYILRTSKKDMIFINSDSKLNYNYFFRSEGVSQRGILLNTSLSFSNYYFDIDKDDIIYGILNNQSLDIVTFDYQSNNFNIVNKIEYDYTRFSLDFPYIKFIDDDIHVIYYLTDRSSSITILFHHYRHNGIWFENKIDFIDTSLLDSFTVFFNNDSPIVFYIGSINGITQILTSSFNISTCMWADPVQLTNSITNKVYLSVINDSMNFYHITFSEGIDNGYCIRYLNGYLNSNKFSTSISKLVTSSKDCSFPSLITHKESLYLMWIQDKILYTIKSADLGLSWSDNLEDIYSMSNKFIRSFIKSNYKDDLEYNCSFVFISDKDICILGLNDK